MMSGHNFAGCVNTALEWQQGKPHNDKDEKTAADTKMQQGTDITEADSGMYNEELSLPELEDEIRGGHLENKTPSSDNKRRTVKLNIGGSLFEVR